MTWNERTYSPAQDRTAHPPGLRRAFPPTGRSKTAGVQICESFGDIECKGAKSRLPCHIMVPF